jgi:hypothetical protein
MYLLTCSPYYFIINHKIPKNNNKKYIKTTIIPNVPPFYIVLLVLYPAFINEEVKIGG